MNVLGGKGGGCCLGVNAEAPGNCPWNDGDHISCLLSFVVFD